MSHPIPSIPSCACRPLALTEPVEVCDSRGGGTWVAGRRFSFVEAGGGAVVVGGGAVGMTVVVRVGGDATRLTHTMLVMDGARVRGA